MRARAAQDRPLALMWWRPMDAGIVTIEQPVTTIQPGRIWLMSSCGRSRPLAFALAPACEILEY